MLTLLDPFFLYNKAAKSGDVSILERYLEDGKSDSRYECNPFDHDDMSPLHYAAKYNRVEIIEKLLKFGAGRY